MLASVRAFLHEIIDYAGLFPPAKLPLAEALAIYLHEKKTSPHRWMLGKFVCPAARLAELLPLARAHEDGALLQVTVLGAQGPSVEGFFLQIEAAIKAIEAFRIEWGTAEVIDALEIPLPGQAEIERAAYYLGYAAEHLKQARLCGYLELPPSGSWRTDLGVITPRLHELHDTFDESRLGLKLRCGGLAPAAFPSNADVAFFIAQCRDFTIPWKATAGLHHPRRYWDAHLNLWHHGFLNVFGAGILAQAHSLTEADLVAILSDRDGEHFHFEAERFSWKDWSVSTASIEEFRSAGPTSFGSCSFDEPREDLTAMAMLP